MHALALSERFLWDGNEMANNEKSENTYTKDDEVNALRAAAEQGNAKPYTSWATSSYTGKAYLRTRMRCQMDP